MRTIRTAMLTFVWAALTLPFAATAADLDGLKILCDSCHGPNGNSPYSDVPTIAGQSSKFIAKQLRSFQLWDRPCAKTAYRAGAQAGTEADKCEIAGKLSTDDINAVADYYSKQPFKAASQPFDAARAAGRAWPGSGNPT